MDDINGKKVAVQEVKIDLLIEQVADMQRLLGDWLKAGGPCELSRRKTDSAVSQLRVVWWVLGVTIPPTLGILIKLAFFK